MIGVSSKGHLAVVKKLNKKKHFSIKKAYIEQTFEWLNHLREQSDFYKASLLHFAFKGRTMLKVIGLSLSK